MNDKKEFKRVFIYSLSNVIDPFDWFKIRHKQHLEDMLSVLSLSCNKHMLNKLIDKSKDIK